MNITPTLPNPHQASAQQEYTVVAPVQAPHRTRDATDQAGRATKPPRVVDEAERAQLASRVDAMATRQTVNSSYANRALASYANVANEGERGSLHEMLGFDAYA